MSLNLDLNTTESLADVTIQSQPLPEGTANFTITSAKLFDPPEGAAYPPFVTMGFKDLSLIHI